MERAEKLHLSADTQNGYCFKQGLFVRLYEQSLFWFVHHIKPLKPMLERVKGGEPVVYGGLPVASFEKLLEEGNIFAETIENGWTWMFAEQSQGAGEDFSGFPTWRETAMHSASVIPMNTSANVIPAQASVLVIPAQAGIQNDLLAPRLRGGDGVGSEHDGINSRDILHEIRAFNLVNSTPIQAMSAMADWQEYLKNDSPAYAKG